MKTDEITVFNEYELMRNSPEYMVHTLIIKANRMGLEGKRIKEIKRCEVINETLNKEIMFSFIYEKDEE